MHFLALFHDPLAIRKWHYRDVPYSELADIDTLRTCREQGRAFVKKKFSSIEETKL